MLHGKLHFWRSAIVNFKLAQQIYLAPSQLTFNINPFDVTPFLKKSQQSILAKDNILGIL